MFHVRHTLARLQNILSEAEDQFFANESAQARRAPDMQHGTETPSRCCVKPPGWVTSSSRQPLEPLID